MSSKPLRFWDLVLYAVPMTLSLRWLSVAAAAGPASLPMWIAAVLSFMAPLVIATAEMAGRFEGEGGIYTWTREAFGPFAGFVCGWLYWTCNIPFFSGLLVFIVNVLAIAAGPKAVAMMQNPALFLACSLLLSIAVAAMHLMGLEMGKWISNFGAAAAVGVLLILIAAGAILALKPAGPATDFVHASYAPPLTADGAILWGTMVFAFGGPEALAFLRNDVEGGIRQILRALAMIGGLLTVSYIAGTSAILSILTPAQATRLSGVPEAVSQALGRLGLGRLAPFCLVLIAVALLGGYSSWFGVAARLPFAAGVDNFLPAAFGRRHPKTGAPIAAILTQSIAVIVLVVFSEISQAGASLKLAYDFLVDMTVISYTLPFVFLFAVYLKVQSRPAPAGAWTAPGGVAGGRAIGWTGLVVAVSAILCTLVPPADAADKAAVVWRLLIASGVLILGGVLIYVWGARRALALQGAEG
ncbi:APC family permease [Phenylobacterium montanum]|uniref:APC family permease n=1 Tax=Phenylobacterium montanum TaxID=2823693 RepID=A0A975FWX8_9CAUL|nr:APC family permease [Caulobacter sp. S6]QUD86930.1 APC family permease [Caulobacter sp. S6]